MTRTHSLLGPAMAALLVPVALVMPRALHAQQPVTLVCNDSTQAPGPARAACAKHGGVNWAATKALSEQQAGAVRGPARTVVCMDGSTAPAGRAACKAHGGVDSVATRAAREERARGRAAEEGRPSEPGRTGADTTGMRPPAQQTAPPADTGAQRRDST
jgi:hypothetical protein